jgi:hypothetical protein
MTSDKLPDNQIQDADQTSRRKFIRKIGKTILSVSVVGFVVGSPQIARACGEGGGRFSLWAS